EVYGITKAYCTRVGSGPFPTELFDETGDKLREIGKEFGATTGRPRRCGWMDLVALKFACMINGVTQLIMTKADVLDEFSELKLCTEYEINGTKTAEVPFQMLKQEIKPLMVNFKGWNTDITKITRAEELPAEMKTYVEFINKYLGVNISFISNGPGRDQLVRI